MSPFFYEHNVKIVSEIYLIFLSFVNCFDHNKVEVGQFLQRIKADSFVTSETHVYPSVSLRYCGVN